MNAKGIQVYIYIYIHIEHRYTKIYDSTCIHVFSQENKTEATYLVVFIKTNRSAGTN